MCAVIADEPTEVARELTRSRIARRVHNARLDRELSMEQSATAAGVSHVTWRRIENGQTVKPKSYSAVDKFLELPTGTTARAVENPAVDETFRPARDGQSSLASDEESYLAIVAGIDGEDGDSTVPYAMNVNHAREIFELLPMLSIADLDRVAREAQSVRRAKAVEVLRAYDLVDPSSLMYARTWSRRSTGQTGGVRLQEFDRLYRRATERVLEAHEELAALRRVYVRASSSENRMAVEQLEVELNDFVREAKVHLHRYFRLLEELKKHAAENESQPLFPEMEVGGP